jgi:hypothetical protein
MGCRKKLCHNLTNVRRRLSPFAVLCRLIVTVAAFFTIAEVSPCEEPPAALDGYATRAASPSDFDVNGFRVLLTGTTAIEQNTGTGQSVIAADNLKLDVGMPIRVDGKRQDKSRSITATSLTLLQPELQKTGSTGVIDGIKSLGRRGESTSACVSYGARRGRSEGRVSGFPRPLERCGSRYPRDATSAGGIHEAAVRTHDGRNARYYFREELI